MSFVQRRKLLKVLLVILLIGIAAVFFYQCPIRLILGIPCPGCGMTRALLCFLRGDLAGSFYWHPMLVPTGIGAILVLYALAAGKEKLLGITLLVWTILMILVYVWRMAAYFPQEPMLANPDGLLMRFLG